MDEPEERDRPAGRVRAPEPRPDAGTSLSVRLVVAGVVAAVLGVLAALAGLVGFAATAGPQTRRGWEVTLLASAVLMVLVCLAQLFCWRRARAGRAAGPVAELTGVARGSWVVHLISYGVVLAALLSGLGASADAVWTTSSAAWFTGSMALVIAAQVLGGVQYVRLGGPPGTVPAHLRRLGRWLEEQRRLDDDPESGD